MSKLRLYISTALHLKPSQIVYRIWRRLGGTTRLRLGYSPSPDLAIADVSRVPVLPELDFDPAFLMRFDADAIVGDRIELLHHEEEVDWDSSWHAPLSTPLWRFNLHYCEYLLPLAKAYLDTGDARYLDKGKAIIISWIESCPRSEGGVAWDPYVISMRAVNWLAYYGELRSELGTDSGFVESLNRSLAEQFVHLSQHLEKDLLANHYLENLKALVILSCYFNDVETLGLALSMLYRQVEEQILPDGMHFELSPMYHKIVLEDLLRVACCLVARGEDTGDVADRLRLQRMCDALWSLERNTSRTPLFNDSGDNVAKSRDALLQCAQVRFGIAPVYHNCLPDAGYYFLEKNTDSGTMKVIFDIGVPSPGHASGHMHCDALSIEVFVGGTPWVVNLGTFAYQGESRLKQKSTESHSTVQVVGVEQSECWAPFRVARMAMGISVQTGKEKIAATICDCRGNRIERCITMGSDVLVIDDTALDGKRVSAHYHLVGAAVAVSEGTRCEGGYSPEFGSLAPTAHITEQGRVVSMMLRPFEKEIERIEHGGAGL